MFETFSLFLTFLPRGLLCPDTLEELLGGFIARVLRHQLALKGFFVVYLTRFKKLATVTADMPYCDKKAVTFLSNFTLSSLVMIY